MPFVNCRLAVLFQASLGLCQGFPLSPLLYLIIAESLSKKIQDMQNNGELRGLKIARGVKNANHAQYADDTILLGGSSIIIAERFREVISTFLKASYGKMNSVKSKIYGWNCPARTMARIAKMLGYEGYANWNSFKYLEVPIHKGKKKKSNWKELVEKIKNKIQSLGAI